MLRDAKILVVDDVPANLEVVTETLSLEGSVVTVASSGERAIKQLNRHLPHLILLDIQMPGMNGFETCKAIKANPDWKHIPIIFLTALSDTDSILRGFEVGAVDYISKPFREPELLARVKNHLQLQRITQTLEQQVAERTAALVNTMDELKLSQLRLVKQEKMSALGNLVAGIAHEINNPVGCIVGNVDISQDYIDDLLGLLDLYAQELPDPSDVLKAELEIVDPAYVREDLTMLMEAMKSSSDRIQDISKSLRVFSRSDMENKQIFDIREGINSTVLILRHRLKANVDRPEIQVLTNYSDYSQVCCFPGQLNQVFMNILANAIDMFDEMALQTTFEDLEVNPQKITIQTVYLLEQDTVEIQIADNGKGMPDEVEARIFEHLFTTKAVGKGTGLGLAIAQQIVTDVHGGSIEVRSAVGEGSCFVIRLPLQVEELVA